MKLPEAFLDNMKQLLGEEYDAWLASYDEEPVPGLRINLTKCDCLSWENQINPFSTARIPWTANGYYYQSEEKPSRHPFYYAGLYYLQEPSAMLPAQLLPVHPGDRVLDICAAPGGKSTELAARLAGEGLLVANDISNSRAQALLKNLELFGISNMLVTSEAPDKLADTFGRFFDKILVDAPCSGEGMFRKDPALIRSWEDRGPEYYVPIQREILKQSVRMLAPGGYLLYSTCTFASAEDEDNINWLLEQEPSLELSAIPLFDGAEPGADGSPVIRLFPHKIKGEGHFAALLRKKEETEPAEGDHAFTDRNPAAGNEKELRFLDKETDLSAFLDQLGRPLDRSRMMIRNDQIYYLPAMFDRRWKLRYLRTGLLLGECRRGRFGPSQALAMALSQQDFCNTLSFSSADERTIRYLKGETVAVYDHEHIDKGWCLVCVDGFPLGWAKSNGRTLKNKYYPGWRWL
ncbi:MAG: RsmF rRNA methyltransferase first C-terminal domain-containing protein [Lachnospiraceae bacterium]